MSLLTVSPIFPAQSSDNKLHTFAEKPNIQKLESNILTNLVKKTPNLLNFEGFESLPNSENLNTTNFNTNVMITSKLPDSNIVMTSEFITNTIVEYENSEFNEIVNKSEENSLVGNIINIVKLGNDTAPLYNGQIEFEYIEGDREYYTEDGHLLSFDNTDIDYNIQKAVNSKLMNTYQNAEDPLSVGFDNDFNSNNSIYTSKILTRDHSNNQLFVSSDLSSNAIFISNGISNSSLSNILEIDLVDNNNVPLFGSLKFEQDPVRIDVRLTHIDSSSNLSIAKPDTSDPDVVCSVLPLTISEDEFKALFTSQELEKIGIEYEFTTTIGNSDGITEYGGYGITSDYNHVSIPQYNIDNEVFFDNTLQGNLFNIDDSDIHNNIKYMKNMKQFNLFDQHKLFVKNGDLKLNPNNSTNKNFDKFVVHDGFESLIAPNSGDEADVTKSGIITVLQTNNNLGNDYSRVTKLNSNDNTLSRVLLSYESSENDYLPNVGVLSNIFTDNYYVNSKLYTLTKSTITNDDQWNTTSDVAMNNDSVLVFQNIPNSVLYNKSNVFGYQAEGLNQYIGNNKFALIQVNKTLNFTDCAESPFFLTSNNTALEYVIPQVSMTNADLNDIQSDDIRINVYCKKLSDIPSILDNTNKWYWATGDENDELLMDSENNVILNNNDSFLISEKDDTKYIDPYIYEILDLPNTKNINIDVKLYTNTSDVVNKNTLFRKAMFTISTNDKVYYTYDVPDKNLKITNINESSQNENMDLTNLIFSNDTPLPITYLVKKIITTKTYLASIKVTLGAYTNLWATRIVTDVTETYELYNNNKLIPESQLAKITGKTVNQRSNKIPAFLPRRNFVVDSINYKELNCRSTFTSKDFTGFTVSAQYRNINENWINFQLENDDNGHSLEMLFDKNTTFNILYPNTQNIFSTITIAIDTTAGVVLGLKAHKSSNNESMYMLNISNSTGENSFEVKGYLYDITNDSQYLNKDKSWSPYAVNDDLFLKNTQNERVGTGLQLKSIVTLMDPTPEDDINVNEVNYVKVTVKTINDIELFSFTSTKYILENFNIIATKNPIIQHEYKIGLNEQNISIDGNEYLTSNFNSGSESFYTKLLYGNNYNGVRLNFNSNTVRGSNSEFKFNGDKVCILPIVEPHQVANNYSGRYSSQTGVEILPSATGKPLPTNSTIHRNIHPTVFRGLKYDDPIQITRTETLVKMTFGSKFQSNLTSNSNLSFSKVWKNKGTDSSEKLAVTHIFNATEAIINSVNQNENTQYGSDIGSLNLIVVPNYSMFPKSLGTSKYEIPIDLTPAVYEKQILNPLDTSLESTVYSNVFDVVLHDFISLDVVAQKIKVYTNEIFRFKYGLPDINVYYSSNYVNDPRNYSNWSFMNSYSDRDLRDGIVIGQGINSGILKFTRNMINVSAHTKYCILPRPIAYVEAYDASTLTSLPADLSSNVKVKRFFDIDITDSVNHSEGLSVANQNHKPFNKSPGSNNTSNDYYSLSSNICINNFKLGLNISKYLYFKINTYSDFTFTINSNKVKIFNKYGGSNSLIKTKIFEGYISDLNNRNNWDNELASTINNNFDEATKKWSLNTRQLISGFEYYIDVLPNVLTSNFLFVNGITSFGLGTYSLDLKLMDSVVNSYYAIDYGYNENNDKLKVNFHKLSTGEGINWGVTGQFEKMDSFKPQIISKQICALEIPITNQLGDSPINISEIIYNNLTNNEYDLETKIIWQNVNMQESIPNPIRFAALSNPGAYSLSKMLHVTGENKFKVFASYRPPVLTVKSLDGSLLTEINNDGSFIVTRLFTNELQLEAKKPAGSALDIGIEFFKDNITPSLNV